MKLLLILILLLWIVGTGNSGIFWIFGGALVAYLLGKCLPKGD